MHKSFFINTFTSTKNQKQYMKKFTVKPNFGFWKIVDKNDNHVVGFVKKENADKFARELNELTDEIQIYYRIEQCRGVKLESGDKIIWDSHFGYELGYFVGNGIVFEHYYQVNLTTSRVGGLASFSQSEIHPYSEELLNLLSKKYGYKKSLH